MQFSKKVRKIFLFLGVACFLIVFLTDIGSSFLHNAKKPPGLELRAMSLVDGLMLLGVGLFAAAQFVGYAIYGRLSGITTLVVAILVLLAAIAMIFAAFGLLMLMISIFLAFPFGPLIYAAIWGHFAKGTVQGILAGMMTLRIAGGILLLLWEPRVLTAKSLVLLFITTLLCSVILSFILGLVPGLFGSIGDAIGAIVMGIVAVIWAIYFIISGALGTLKALKPPV